MSVQPGSELADIFGKDQVGDRVKSFDFSQISSNEKWVDYLNIRLAPSYGYLNSDTLPKLSDELQITIASTVKALSKIPSGQRYGDTVISSLRYNPVLKLDDSGSTNLSRTDKLVKSSSSDLRYAGSAIVQEVKSWLSGLIKDQNVLDSTKIIENDVLAKIVAQIGAILTSFESLGDEEIHEKFIVDIEVLQFPGVSNPYFKFYSIRIKAWSNSSNIMFNRGDKMGISGEYKSKQFNPDEDLIAGMKQETKRLAIAQVKGLFDRRR